jgi:peptidoglycan/xylan/chitin deacetylase (PgdA/CDA1 family)
MFFKNTIAHWVHTIAHFSGISLVIAKSKKVLRIIMIHQVGTGKSSKKIFKQQMLYLSSNFEVITIDEAIKRLKDSKHAMNREVVLTFDDGLRNNVTNALPILYELDLPAVFYVCPMIIDQQKWLWNHEARARLNSMKYNTIHRLAMRIGTCKSSADEIVEWMKTLSIDKRNAVEFEIRKETSNFEPTRDQHQEFDPMTWFELTNIGSLITIGAHTNSHPILTSLNDEQLLDEINNSRSKLEERTGRKVEHFCYPNGVYNKKIEDIISRHFKSAVTTEERLVRQGQNIFQLPRIPIASSCKLFVWRMNRPSA